jgi:hypothetical protein
VNAAVVLIAFGVLALASVGLLYPGRRALAMVGWRPPDYFRRRGG